MHDEVALLRQTVNFTATQLSFAARLVEKDYYASVLLEYLSAAEATLVFKGGTCLSKVYVQFYRLSEDLDFTIPISSEATRSERSRAAAGLKKAFADIPVRLPGFRIAEPLKGTNSSSQYIGLVGYRSVIAEDEDFIKIDAGLREPLLTPAKKMPTHTALLNPMTGKEEFPPLSIPCISLIEAYAEKCRAAMTRREVAVRDYFDIDNAVARSVISLEDPILLALVKRKLAVPGTDPVNVSAARLEELKPQVERELKSVLRESELRTFELPRAFRLVETLAQTVGNLR
jgi:predicted nucleotidyltransferase component of viral defense system